MGRVANCYGMLFTENPNMKNKHVLSFILVIFISTVATAQHVVPVTYFGKNGVFQRNINNAYVDARHAIVQPDGKLLFSITSDDDFSYSTSELLYRLDKKFKNKGDGRNFET